MFRTTSRLLLLLVLTAFRADKAAFSGVIIYKNTFTTLQGQDISDKLAPYLGAENHYYISGNNYKTYNERRQLIQLYTGATNQYVFFKDGLVVQQLDAAKPTATDVKITPLPETITILGHACQALQVVADGVTTMYFYAPDLKVQPADYRQHLMGDWAAYLRATQGSLALKYITINPKVGYVITSEATSVRPLKLTAADFTPTAAEPLRDMQGKK